MDLRHYERDTVENQAQMVVNEIYADEKLNQVFDLAGSVTFESHTNLGISRQGPVTDDANVSSLEGQGPEKRKRKNSTEDVPVSKGQADRFCVYRGNDQEDVPAIAIEYKAPHKLTCDEIVAGLVQEIQPARDVINKEEEDTTEFYSKRLVTVVITQLFSYMVVKGVRYGYICTGEVFVFLHILDDPSIVEYAISIPNRDVRAGHEQDFEFTAVAQVVAFTMRALASPPPSQVWSDAAGELGVWPVEYAEILEQTPPSKRLKTHDTAYRGKKGGLPFHMNLRSCRPDANLLRDRSPSPPAPGSPSPTPNTLGTGKSQATARPQGSTSQEHGYRSGNQGKKTSARVPIQDRPYYSQNCLLGLRDRGSFDSSCPNFQDHRRKAIPNDFLAQVRQQLAADRGYDADCRPLYKAGSYGALFKIRLSSHGFTIVAKGAILENSDTLVHESKIYDKLRDIQGLHVPVCLGVVQLKPGLPYHYDGGRHTHMLLMSWAGSPIARSIAGPDAGRPSTPSIPSIPSLVKHSLQEIHSRGVLHGDAEPRNILWNDPTQRPMIVDFGRASIKTYLSIISPNTRKRKFQEEEKVEDEFSAELNGVQRSIDRLYLLKQQKEIRMGWRTMKRPSSTAGRNPGTDRAPLPSVLD